jgi:hypothetical protein
MLRVRDGARQDGFLNIPRGGQLGRVWTVGRGFLVRFRAMGATAVVVVAMVIVVGLVVAVILVSVSTLPRRTVTIPLRSVLNL